MIPGINGSVAKSGDQTDSLLQLAPLGGGSLELARRSLAPESLLLVDPVAFRIVSVLRSVRILSGWLWHRAILGSGSIRKPSTTRTSKHFYSSLFDIDIQLNQISRLA